ncbi:hypothetical protein PTTG_07678, partial [Puccinia triticina 1-1 BBBD Race 1]
MPINHPFHPAHHLLFQDLGPLIVTESWKSWKDALGKVNYAASLVDWFVEEALRTEWIIVPSSTPAVRNLVIKQPIGVVAALCPWNFPAANITRKVARTACTIRPPAMAPQAARLPRPPPPPPWAPTSATQTEPRNSSSGARRSRGRRPGHVPCPSSQWSPAPRPVLALTDSGRCTGPGRWRWGSTGKSAYCAPRSVSSGHVRVSLETAYFI